jgi:hypothetical protein
MQQGSRRKGTREELYVSDIRGVDQQHMANTERGKTAKPKAGKARNGKQQGADWASGLKQLYDSVLDEPIPDAFKDLLSKLDSGTK